MGGTAGRARSAKERCHVVAMHWGFLEIFFATALVGLVGAVGVFALFVGIQLFRNPGRRPGRP
jgi:hypothetical protein